MRRAWPWLAIAAAVVLIGLASRGPRDSGEPLDPRSTGPLGARGVVVLLEELGARVAIGAAAGGDVTVAFVDDLGSQRRRELLGWVGAGGTLVVTDPASPLLGAPATGAGGRGDAALLEPACDLPLVGSIGRISVPGAVGLRAPAGGVGCFPVDEGFYLAARQEGSGTVLSLGGAAPFTNERLDEEHNAALAAAVLGARPGVRVTVLAAALPGAGDETLTDLLPGGVRRGLWQLGAAFVALVLWRSRRLARPVAEPQPVAIPAADLVLATGNLLRHARRREDAADMLRRQLRRELAVRRGVPVDAQPELVVQALSSRGVPAARAAAALVPRPLADDAELVRAAAAIDELRNEVIHG